MLTYLEKKKKIGRIDFSPFFDFSIAIMRHLQLTCLKSDFIFEFPSSNNVKSIFSAHSVKDCELCT